jgi:acyl carrier protein
MAPIGELFVHRDLMDNGERQGQVRRSGKPVQQDQAIQNAVRQFIVSNYLFGQMGDFPEEESFLQAGIIDSTGVLELVAFLEETFGIRVVDHEMTTDNLDSIGKVARFVLSKTNNASGIAGATRVGAA